MDKKNIDWSVISDLVMYRQKRDLSQTLRMVAWDDGQLTR